jgi:hypothetical protein
MKHIFIAMFATVLYAHADTTLQSGPHRVSLLELYTSEGCSSCPPAEAWMEELKNSPRLWNDLVPVAFHVDYWDHLGWKDPFARAEYTSRQRAYSVAWGNSSVYTPGFVLDGQEWQGWFAGNPLPDPGKQFAGTLGLKISNKRATIEYSGVPGVKQIDVYLVPLQMDASSEVLAGENRGRHLTHSFVALALASHKLNPEDGKFQVELPFDYPGASAVAVWVAKSGSGQPLQAAGGYLK